MLSLITGVGSRGQVGEAVAAELARRGDRVLVVARSAGEASERARELKSAGHDAHGYACDLADERAVTDLARRVADDHGARLDALVNLAGGFAMSGPLADSDVATVRRMIDINFMTAYNATRSLLPLVRAARGSIVYFASENVLDGARTKGTAAYTAAKAAVVALMRSVADEGRDTGIRANAVAPTSIRTATNVASMGTNVPYVEREDVAATVAFLCSEASRAITGQLIRLK